MIQMSAWTEIVYLRIVPGFLREKKSKTPYLLSVMMHEVVLYKYLRKME